MDIRTAMPQALPLEAEGGDSPRISGYFAVFDSPYHICDDIMERVDPHAFDDCLGDDIRALIDHDTRLVLGRTAAQTLTLRTDAHGLWGDILINPVDTEAMNAHARVQRRDVSQCSFGFEPLEVDQIEEGGCTIFILRRVKLFEVSVCTFPAYEGTEVSARTRAEEHYRAQRRARWAEEQKRRVLKWH